MREFIRKNAVLLSRVVMLVVVLTLPFQVYALGVLITHGSVAESKWVHLLRFIGFAVSASAIGAAIQKWLSSDEQAQCSSKS